MDDGRRQLLGEVFAPLDALEPDVRLKLADLLAEPGAAPAIRPASLAAAPLPGDPERRAAIVEAILAGLDASVLASLADRRIDTVVPVLACHAAAGVAIGRRLPARLRDGIDERAGATPVIGLTVGQVAGWPGVGRRRVALLVAAAVEAGMELVGPVESGARPILDDVVAVLVHDSAAGGELRRHLEHLAAIAPDDVGTAARRLLAMPTTGPARCLAVLEAALACAGDIRDRAVFEHGVLPVTTSMSRAELGERVGVGPERIRQLAVRAADRVDASLAAAPPAVHDLAATVASRVGAAAPAGAVDDVLGSCGMPALPDPRALLLLRLAGPYRPVAQVTGWMARDPSELLAETRRMTGEDGGVRLVEHIVKELDSLGVLAAHVHSWLARQPVRTVDGLVVSIAGTPGDVAERALHATGRPMPVHELETWADGDAGAVEALWSARDRRFVVTPDDELALAEWGGPAIAATLFDDDDEIDQPATLRIAVDRDVLAGAGGAVSPALARASGLARGVQRTFATRYGPLSLTYAAEGPARGSVRPVALAVGAGVGDELVFTLYPDGRGAAVRLVPADQLDPAEP